MNKQDAIKWIGDKYQGYWPNNTRNPAPDGWKWVVGHEPYSNYLYFLVDEHGSKIAQGDIKNGNTNTNSSNMSDNTRNK